VEQLKMRTPSSERSAISARPCTFIHRRRGRATVAMFFAAVGFGAMAAMVASSRSGPLLVAVDEMKLDARTTVTSVGPADQSHLAHSRLPIAHSPLPVADSQPASAHSPAPVSVDHTHWFNGRPVRPARTMSMIVTGYSPDARSCGNFADGITASGLSVHTNNMRLAAADTRVLPFGSMISIPGYDDGRVIPVLDRGGAIKGNRIDLLFPTHEIARQWGVQRLEVTVWEYADGQPNGFVPRFNKNAAVQD
jgi:3D (Asp-Asp-Asp) domain-containing protein